MPLDLAAIAWRITNDGVMGGLSRSTVHAGDGALVFEGELSRENNGGFASVLGALDHPLRPFRGVRLTVAGDGRRYQVRLRSDDDARGIAWRAEFEAGPEPCRITLTPRDFEPVFRGRPVADAPALSGVTIRHFGFMLAGGEAGRFRLQVESAEFGAAADENSNGRRLVIGASRGIGLALTAAQLADAGVRSVIATHRAGSDMRGLDDLRERHGERLVLRTLDVTRDDDLEGFTNWLTDQDGGVDLAIHAAGLLHDGDLQPEKSVSQCDAESLQRLFAVNAIAPLLTARAVLAAQGRSRRFTFAAISAMVGSIGDNRLGGWYGYRASKAALNQFMRTLANECRVRHPRAAIVSIHPGTTDTDLSHPFQRNIEQGKLYTPEQTARRILDVLEPLGPPDSGRFFHWDGSEIPW
jgi:NAD(P)-dependent dehydrogenase (short-subunit alcohol dehydrogenase family)